MCSTRIDDCGSDPYPGQPRLQSEALDLETLTCYSATHGSSFYRSGIRAQPAPTISSTYEMHGATQKGNG